MSYYSIWTEKINDNSDEGRFNKYVEHYYLTEQKAYDTILSNYPDFDLSGTGKELAQRLGYTANDMDVFLGFLEGINPSLHTAITDFDSIDDETNLSLDIDYEKLLYNMHDAGAAWLFNLDSWQNVLSPEKIAEIGHDYRTEHIAVSKKIAGRNDPCPCGSGKKYKNCHGR